MRNKYIPFPILIPLVVEKEKHKTPLEKALSATFEYMQEEIIKKILHKLPDEIKSGVEMWSEELNPIRFAFNLLLFQLDVKNIKFDKFEKKESFYEDLENDARIRATLSKEDIRKIIDFFDVSIQNFERFSLIKEKLENCGNMIHLSNVIKTASVIEFLMMSLVAFISGKVTIERESILAVLDLSHTFLKNYNLELDKIIKQIDSLENPSLLLPSIQPNASTIHSVSSHENSTRYESNNSISRSKDWLREFSRPYEGKWVAVLDGRLLGFDITIKNLYQKLDSSVKNNKNLIITKVISE